MQVAFLSHILSVKGNEVGLNSLLATQTLLLEACVTVRSKAHELRACTKLLHQKLFGYNNRNLFKLTYMIEGKLLQNSRKLYKTQEEEVQPGLREDENPELQSSQQSRQTILYLWSSGDSPLHLSAQLYFPLSFSLDGFPLLQCSHDQSWLPKHGISGYH